MNVRGEGLMRGISWGMRSKATMPCKVLQSMKSQMSALLCWRVHQFRWLSMLATLASRLVVAGTYASLGYCCNSRILFSFHRAFARLFMHWGRDK